MIFKHYWQYSKVCTKMDTLLLDVGLIIHNLLDFPSQVNLRLVSIQFSKYYPITNLCDKIRNRYNLNDKILKNYPHVIKLNAANNRNITSVNHMKNLQMLVANSQGPSNLYIDNCAIDDYGIQDSENIVVLYVDNNSLINNINHLKKLKVLYANGANCHITDLSIKDLKNLVAVHSEGNVTLTGINLL